MASAHVAASIEAHWSEHIRKVEGLWERVYAKELEWLVPGATRRADAYHPHSAYVLLELVSEDGLRLPVGTARLVADSPAGLPIERFFPLGPLKEDRKFIEIQRLVVVPEFRSKRFVGAPFGLMARMMREIMRYAIGAGRASFLVADVFDDPQVSPIGPLREIGFDQIGVAFQDTELHSATPSYAMVINRSRFIEQVLSSRASALLRYVAGIDHRSEQAPLRRPAVDALVPLEAAERP